MKLFKSLSHVRLLLFASLFLASCGEQTELEQPGVTNGETVVVTKELRFDVLPMHTVGSPSTRSASDKPEQGASLGITYGDDAATRGTTDMTSDESAIHNAYILQFDGTAPTSVLKTVKAITAEELKGTASITCDFSMTEGVKNRVYVVANLTQNQIDGINGSVATPVTLADFEKPVDLALGETLPETGLPMSSMQDIGVGDVFDVFRLKSILAKLNFTCKTEGTTLLLKGVPSGYSFAQAQPGDAAVRLNGITYDNAGVALTSGTAYYVPANLSGRVQLSSPLVRCSLFAPANSLFVEISANSTTYNIYLGEGSASDFNFSGGCAYNINATLYGTSDLDLRVGTSSVIALDRSGTANCYIADAGKWYSFNATVMGNGVVTPAHTKSAVSGDLDFPAITPSTLTPASADVLWESVNTATAPAKGTIVDDAFQFKSRIYFRTSSTSGNAVIAAKDASGTIIWSWHIWRITDTPVGVTLASITDGSGFTAPTLKMMDRTLGALRATPNTGLTPEQDYGLYYQWGRKDPFQTQGTVTTAAGGSSITPADAVKNPTTFYTNSGVWALRNDNLWGCPFTELTAAINSKQFNKNAGIKSIYDPCPVGWKVMPSYAFANATKDNSPWDATNKGRDFAVITTSAGTPFFLSALGSRALTNGTLTFIGTYGNYWSSSPNVTYTDDGGLLYFGGSSVSSTSYVGRASGNGVRCVQ